MSVNIVRFGMLLIIDLVWATRYTFFPKQSYIYIPNGN